MAGIYIHIPFCNQACYYCDFHFSTNKSLQAELCQAIVKEINLQKNYLETEFIETIYLGGGTPSILIETELSQILDSVRHNFTVIQNPEITLEANPDDLTLEKLQWLSRAGLNRLSIGVQSFDDKVLRFLNRSHSNLQAKEAIENARAAGFKNISVDLIYAIPDRSIDLLKTDLDTLLSFHPEHISAYSLTIEEKTVFGKWHQAKKFTSVSEEENAKQFELVMDTLTQAGYAHYEISNYAKPGYISQHNSNYWKQRKYLGIGPSAHSFDGISRQANISNNNTYLKSIIGGQVPSTREVLTRENQINEYIMTSLRTSWGCDLNFLQTQYQFNLLQNQHSYINENLNYGLMILEENILKLTREGKMHADRLSSDLFLIT